MTSKRFALSALLLIGLLSLGFVAFNVAMNEFGLYGDDTGTERRVWTYNRASKYLLSLNHIPANFDGILIGSSSSASMMDTRLLDGYRIYNLSMNGGNICEVSRAALKALESGRMKYLIISLDPYLTKNAHMKTSELHPDLETSVLGSLFTVRFYLYKLWYTLRPEIDAYRESWWGYRITPQSEQIDVEAMFLRKRAAKVTSQAALYISPQAVDCLRDVIDAAHAHNTAIIAYFHPRSYLKLRVMDYEPYKTTMRELFGKHDLVLDLTGPGYTGFRSDWRNYHDRVHLSAIGARQVLHTLQEALNAQQQ